MGLSRRTLLVGGCGSAARFLASQGWGGFSSGARGGRFAGPVGQQGPPCAVFGVHRGASASGVLDWPPGAGAQHQQQLQDRQCQHADAQRDQLPPPRPTWCLGGSA